jgi:DNA-binding MarR family transcriptional regulator
MGAMLSAAAPQADPNPCVCAILACVHASGSSTKAPTPVSKAVAAAASAEPGSPAAIAADFSLLLKQVMSVTNRDFFIAIEESGLTFTQMKCLHILGDTEEPLPISAVSETLGLSGPAISRAVDALVQRGEVKRTEDPRDRRSKLLTLSARGRRTVERLAALRFAGVKRFVEGLPDDEREALAAAIGPIARRLET